MRFIGKAQKSARKSAKTRIRKTAREDHSLNRGFLKLTRKPALLRISVQSLFTALVLGGGAMAWSTGLPETILHQMSEKIIDATVDAGLDVREVYVTGRNETDKDAILEALSVNVGDPILTFDPHAARARLESLGWVKTAAVRKRLPNLVTLTIEEREAIAIWQHDGQYVLIDPDGVQIGQKNLNRHEHLKVVVGPDAPAHTAELLTLLSSEPELLSRVVAAQRVGARRWNVHLEGGVAINLPEEDAAIAWRRLATYQKEHEILSRAVERIDLRHPDRLTLQLTGPGLQEVQERTIGEET
jgi:cell division protein FtsQ